MQDSESRTGDGDLSEVSIGVNQFTRRPETDIPMKLGLIP